jgi:SAM-dependent methyltransferase
MAECDFDDRRLSFGAASGSYADYRPGYPDEALQWVLALATRPVQRIADVGAGAGALTRSLVRLAPQVEAFDPDLGMLDELGRRLPDVARHQAPAEQLPLPDASVDAVVVGQAWHWFDRAAAASEFTRVVRPGGVIGLLWNVRDDREPWLAALSDLIDGEDSLRAGRADALHLVAAVHPQVMRRDFTHRVAMAPEAVVGLVSTFSYVRLRPDADAVLASVRELLATHPDTAGRATVDLPYVTAAYRVPCP